MSLGNEVRLEETACQLRLLRQEIDNWLGGWRTRDKRQQYHSQLNTLASFLTRILDALRDDLCQVDPSAAAGQVFAACREADRKLIWLRRSWRLFADKFDQRDDPRFKAVLEAADEVVWSCFAEVFEHGAKERRAAPPLPYIEASYSPLAVPRDDPRLLKDPAISGDFFRQHLAQLPIPLVGLPPTCVEAPWWLVYLGHEVGHHVQADLLPDRELETRFAAWLAEGAGGGPAGDQWSLWSQEVFADLFSLLMLGVPALWAMTELEMGPDDDLLAEKRSNRAYYPPPAVRLALMAALAGELGQAGAWGLRGLVDAATLTAGPPGESPARQSRREAVKAQLDRVATLAQGLRDFSVAGLGRLDDLCGWQKSDFGAGGSVGRWKNRLRGSVTYDPGASLPAPRLIVSGAVAAWAEIAALADEGQRAKARQALKEALPGLVVANRKEGERAAIKPPGVQDAGALGDQVAGLLRGKSAQELGL